MVYDADFVYGQNFFVFLTEEAKTRYLEATRKPTEAEAAEAAAAQEVRYFFIGRAVSNEAGRSKKL